MTPEVKQCFSEAKAAMQKALEHFADELTKIRAGKANPAMLDPVRVEMYGAQMPVNQLATISVSDAKTIVITPFDKNSLAEIEKAIFQANLGLTPQNNGETVIISIPPMTEDRRKDLVKQAKAQAEDCKVSLRNCRKSGLDVIKGLKDDGLSEDLARDAESEMQNITNGFGNRVDELFKTKEAEVLKV